MTAHTYLRFLARVSARQPLLRAPPDASLNQVSPSDFLSLMPYTHPISGYRNRSFEQRQLELHVTELPANEQPTVSCPFPALGRGSPRRRPTHGDGPPPSTAGTAVAAGKAAGSGIADTAAAGAAAAGAAASHLTPDTARYGGAHSHPFTEDQLPQPHSNPNRHPYQHQSQSSQPSWKVQSDGGNTTTNIAAAAAAVGPGTTTARSMSGSPALTLRPSASCAASSSPSAAAITTTAALTNPAKSPAEPPAPEAHGGGAIPSPGAASPPPPPPPPPHSYMEVRYPFTAQPRLWRQYHRLGFPALDPALIIEDFDTFAADVAARHVGRVPDSMLVTAFLERLTWHVHLRPGDGLVPAGGAGGGGNDAGDGRRLALLAPADMRLAGQVTWVGRSSMEVLLQLTTAEAPPASSRNGRRSGDAAVAGEIADRTHPPTPPGSTVSCAVAEVHRSPPLLAVLPPGHLVATAEFVMALRDLSLRRAVDVPPLHPRDNLERELFQRGRENQQQRQARRERERDVALAAGRPGTPARSGGAAAAATATPPEAFPTADSTAAAPAAAAAASEPELACMLYENILGSDFARTIPTYTDALRLLEVDSELEPEPEPPPAATPSKDHARRAKRLRLEVESIGDAEDGAGGGSRDRGGQKSDTAANAVGKPQPQPQPPLLPLGRLDASKPEEPPSHRRKTFGLPPLDGTDGVAALSTAPTPIRQTEVHRTIIAQFQDRNTSGTVFGGHLLRLAYEQAATAAAAFAGGPCELLWMEEGAISSPARVGDALHAVARVVWAEPGGRALRIVVRVGKYNVSAPSQHVLALTLTAAFLAPPLPGAGPAAAAAAAGVQGVERGMQSSGRRGGLRSVVPTTLTEAGEALAAQRRHEATMAALARVEEADGSGVVAGGQGLQSRSP